MDHTFLVLVGFFFVVVVENWIFELNYVVTLEIRFSFYPKVCCLLLFSFLKKIVVHRLSAIVLRCKFRVFSGLF